MLPASKETENNVGVHLPTIIAKLYFSNNSAMRVRDVFGKLRAISSPIGLSGRIDGGLKSGKGGDSQLAGSSSSKKSLDNGRKTKRSLPRSSFLKLARQRRFIEMLEILEKPFEYDIEGWLFHNTVASNRSSRPLLIGNSDDDYKLHLFRGESPLHVILPFHPPVENVDLLIQYLSASKQSQAVPEDVLDMLGRTPLHVAAAHGCSAKVVARLINGVSAIMPAVAKDAMGRHALHWACTNPHGCENDISSNINFRRKKISRNKFIDGLSATENRIQVVTLLLEAYPEAVLIADDEGLKPIDLALAHRSDQRIIELLEKHQEMCQSSCDKKSRAGMEKTENSSAENDAPVSVSLQSSSAALDDMSSIGSSGISHYERNQLKKLLKTSPFQKMTSVEEVIEFIERAVREKNPPLHVGKETTPLQQSIEF